MMPMCLRLPNGWKCFKWLIMNHALISIYQQLAATVIENALSLAHSPCHCGIGVSTSLCIAHRGNQATDAAQPWKAPNFKARVQVGTQRKYCTAAGLAQTAPVVSTSSVPNTCCNRSEKNVHKTIHFNGAASE